ncbi:MAG TPA: AI-2E family transporter, partial [Ramlibacter sp.]|nr:AI-2E family transporter [Ramlibacter sp.]
MDEQANQDQPVDPSPAADIEDPTQVILRVPVKLRSMALVVLTTLALLATLRWASPFFIPLMLGFMLSYALSPVVNGLEQLHIPRWASAAVLILGIIGAIGATAYSFSEDANQLIESLPDAAKKLRDSLHTSGVSTHTPLGTMQKAAAQLEQAAQEAGTPSPAARGVQRVQIEKPRFDIQDHLWNGTLGLASLIGQATIVVFLTYFLLVSGDTFRRKLVKLTGPSLSNKKITVQALDEITQQVQRYLLVQLLSSVVVGVVTALAFWALGLNHAAVWGIAAAVLNMIPYIGSAVIAGAVALVAFVQFGELKVALVMAGISLAIHTVQGNLIVPWLTSKTSRMNPVAVFIGVLAWGWLWGVWGLLLGIPILMAVKAVCDRVEDLKPVGELLGN